MDHSTSGKHTWGSVRDEKDRYRCIGAMYITSSPTGTDGWRS